MKNKLLLFILLGLSTLKAQDQSEKSYKDLRVGISSVLSTAAITFCAFNGIKHADIAAIYHMIIEESENLEILITIQQQQKLKEKIIYSSLTAAAYFFGAYCIYTFTKSFNKDIPSSTEQNFAFKKDQHSL
jgi:hypothetical protein